MQEKNAIAGAGYRLEVRDRVATLTLNQPPLNVLDTRTLAGMTTGLGELSGRSDIGVLVVAGQGKAFSAGVDVGEHRPETVRPMIRSFHGFCRALLDFPRPTVARVHGAALGGGCEVVLCCDLAVAGESARLGQPEVTLGVLPPVAAVLLPRIAGSRAAAETLMWGEILTAEAAMRLGLVTEVVPDAGLDDRVAVLAGRAARLSASTLRLARRMLRRGAEGSLDQAFRAVEEIYLDELMKTDDALEGLASFRERRAPEWRHR